MEPLQEMVEIDEVVSIEIASARTPAACPFCGQMLSRKEQLIKHVNSKHPGKRVEVINITKRFGSKPFVGARRL